MKAYLKIRTEAKDEKGNIIGWKVEIDMPVLAKAKTDDFIKIERIKKAGDLETKYVPKWNICEIQEIIEEVK